MEYCPCQRPWDLSFLGLSLHISPRVAIKTRRTIHKSRERTNLPDTLRCLDRHFITSPNVNCAFITQQADCRRAASGPPTTQRLSVGWLPLDRQLATAGPPTARYIRLFWFYRARRQPYHVPSACQKVTSVLSRVGVTQLDQTLVNFEICGVHSLWCMAVLKRHRQLKNCFPVAR